VKIGEVSHQKRMKSLKMHQKKCYNVFVAHFVAPVGLVLVVQAALTPEPLAV